MMLYLVRLKILLLCHCVNTYRGRGGCEFCRINALINTYSLSDYNIEIEFLTTKKKFENILDNKQFEMFIKENKYEQRFNQSCVTPC